MGFFDVVLLLVIAGICGFLATQMMGAKRVNFVVMIVLGFIGALVGKLIFGFFHLPALWVLNVGGNPFPVVWAVIGAVVVVGLFTFIQQH